MTQKSTSLLQPDSYPAHQARIIGDTELARAIAVGWTRRHELADMQADERAELVAAVHEILDRLDCGRIRVAEPLSGAWITHDWIKQAILLSFRLTPNAIIEGAPGGTAWYDKVPLKFSDWDADRFKTEGFRAVPGAIVRRGAYIARDAVLMPCFVNVGAYIGSSSMIDTWATVGSCAQIGARVHLSGGAGIGGVLEPLQASPVILEDDCFIGARSEIAEGVHIGQGAVIGMGVFIGASTKIIDRTTGEVFQGRVPPYSVVVPGTLPASQPLPNGNPAPSLACAVIVKRVDAQTRSKTAINDLLRT